MGLMPDYLCIMVLRTSGGLVRANLIRFIQSCYVLVLLISAHK